MAIQKEIWERSIVEHLFADDSFMSKAFNADDYVSQGKIVHIPQAGAASKVVKNRTTLPAEVKQRTDTDLTYTLSEFTTDPVLIPHADTMELSYNKRESVLRMDKMTLFDNVAKDFIFNWSPASAHTIKTTGEAADGVPHSTATGKRKALTRQDVSNLMYRFNRDNVPQEGRYLLLDAAMYSQLIDDLTSAEAQAFHALADKANGVLGKIMSFNVMMRSEAALYSNSIAAKSWDTAAAASDLGAALAWHEQSVVRALGQVKAFEQEGAPEYYGDVYSFLVRAGGRIRRSDNKGVWAIVQDVAQ